MAEAPTLQAQPRVGQSTAAETVFNTAELLEQVLLKGSMNDLYLRQRVSKQWYNTISGSKLLQEKMFQLATSTPLRPQSEHCNYGYNVHKINPECTGYISNFKSPTPLPPYIPLKEVRACHPVSLHIIHSLDSDVLEIRPNQNHHEFGHPHQNYYGYDSQDSHNNNTSDEYASWRSMFLTQPPITALEVVSHRDYGRQERCEEQLFVSIYNASGITLQDVEEWYSKLRELSCQERGSGSFDWESVDEWPMSFRMNAVSGWEKAFALED